MNSIFVNDAQHIPLLTELMQKLVREMLNRFTADARHIYITIGATGFRKQISSLVSMVQFQFGMYPFAEACIFVFCNKKKDSVKILRYDRSGFMLAHKKLMEKMKFQWPKDSQMVREIFAKQIEWISIS